MSLASTALPGPLYDFYEADARQKWRSVAALLHDVKWCELDPKTGRWIRL